MSLVGGRFTDSNIHPDHQPHLTLGFFPPIIQPQPLLGLGQGQTASVAPATAIPSAVPQVSQSPMSAYNVYQNALGMHPGLAGAAGLAGAYQTGIANPMAAAGQLSAAAAGSATGASLQAVAAAATSAATQDAVLSHQQQQAKKRGREEELLLVH